MFFCFQVTGLDKTVKFDGFRRFFDFYGLVVYGFERRQVLKIKILSKFKHGLMIAQIFICNFADLLLVFFRF